MSDMQEFMVVHENKVAGVSVIIGEGATEYDAWLSALEFANERQREGGCDALDLEFPEEAMAIQRSDIIADALAELAALPDSRGAIHLYRRTTRLWKAPADEDEQE